MSSGSELIGGTLGGYRIEAKIGSGATGVVYRAIAPASASDGERAVALKVLHDNLGSISGLEKRFAREARVLQKLSHPNIVEIIDYGTDDGRTYIAMELLEGITLEDELEDGAIEPARAIAIYSPILEAVAEAHDHDVVHRDLKPANVFMLADGTVKVLDFGLAKILSVEEMIEEGTLTRKGRIVGTPAYMAPEQITGVFIDVRADVYALGVMLFELLADRRPFLSERRSELLRAHLLEPVPDITSLRAELVVAPELRALLAKALAKDAALRFLDGREMLEALRALPPGAARVEGPKHAGDRTRTEASSAVISDDERRALTASISGGRTMVDSLPAGAAMSTRSERDRVTTKLPDAPPIPTAGLSTGALLGIALVLLVAAVGIWLAATHL
jgi:serine/threonine-protein kinase